MEPLEHSDLINILVDVHDFDLMCESWNNGHDDLWYFNLLPEERPESFSIVSDGSPIHPEVYEYLKDAPWFPFTSGRNVTEGVEKLQVILNKHLQTEDDIPQWTKSIKEALIHLDEAHTEMLERDDEDETIYFTKRLNPNWRESTFLAD